MSKSYKLRKIKTDLPYLRFLTYTQPPILISVDLNEENIQLYHVFIEKIEF